MIRVQFFRIVPVLVIGHDTQMTKVSIVRLCDYPQFAALCAQWDDMVWPRTPEIEEFFSEHYTQAASQRTAVPQVWLALNEDKNPVGMMSLIDDDHPDYIHLSPWLASAFVLPDYRGQGVFRALHDRLVDFVCDDLNLSQLYVYSHIDFTKLGNWTPIEKIVDPFNPDEIVTIFRFQRGK